MVTELAPRPDFEQLLEGADATGQREKRVAAFGHHHLALVHGLDDMQLVQPGVAELARHQRLRDHADDRRAGGERRIGHDAHQPGTPAAVDELPAAPADLTADGLRGIGVNNVLARA